MKPNDTLRVSFPIASARMERQSSTDVDQELGAEHHFRGRSSIDDRRRVDARFGLYHIIKRKSERSIGSLGI